MSKINFTIITLLLVFTTSFNYNGVGENDICKEVVDGLYFPININEKKIIWKDTYYFENNKGKVRIQNKSYTKFEQVWEKNFKATLYLREKNGVVYQYETCCEKETIRYDPDFEVKYKWKTADKKQKYKVISYDGELKTPNCSYKNLLVISAKMTYGNYNFYY